MSDVVAAVRPAVPVQNFQERGVRYLSYEVQKGDSLSGIVQKFADAGHPIPGGWRGLYRVNNDDRFRKIEGKDPKKWVGMPRKNNPNYLEVGQKVLVKARIAPSVRRRVACVRPGRLVSGAGCDALQAAILPQMLAQEKAPSPKQIALDPVAGKIFGYASDQPVTEEMTFPPSFSKARHQSYFRLIDQVSRELGLPAVVLAAVVEAESYGDRYAVSGKNAVGVTQVTPHTALDKAEWLYRQGLLDSTSLTVRDLFDPLTNLRLGASYYRRFYNRYRDEGKSEEHSMLLAACLYFNGEGKRGKRTVDQNWFKDFAKMADPRPIWKTGTKRYVLDVQRRYRRLKTRIEQRQRSLNV